MKRTTAAITALAILASLSVTSSAHHSTAMFAWGEEVEMKDARVLRWTWTNPHTFIYVSHVDADGETRRWAFEGMSPNHLSRAGWSRRTLTAGEVIDLTYYPLRDERPGGFNVTITKADGRTLSQLSQ